MKVYPDSKGYCEEEKQRERRIFFTFLRGEKIHTCARSYRQNKVVFLPSVGIEYLK